MSSSPAFTRHPLGLPAGSVRALLAVIIAGLFGTLVALPGDRDVVIPLFLYFLMSLLLVFMSSHGNSIGGQDRPHPFGMPRGTFRALVILAVGAGLAWAWHNDTAADYYRRLTPRSEQLYQWPTLCAALFGGFVFGRLLRAGPWKNSAVYLDAMATVSLLCMFGLLIETLLEVFVNPTLPVGLNLFYLETGLTGIISLYFGTRS